MSSTKNSEEENAFQKTANFTKTTFAEWFIGTHPNHWPGMATLILASALFVGMTEIASAIRAHGERS